MPPQKLFQIETLDFDHPLYNLEQIRDVNPQRFEMEQLSGILYLNQESQGIIGFKDVTPDEFWTRGHMPGFPLMPGVMMCEAAAQLAGFYARKCNLLQGDFLGFGGMNEVRFRGPVFPGDRLVIMAKLTRLRAGRRAEFDFQGFVGDRMTYSGQMIGVPIQKDGGDADADA